MWNNTDDPLAYFITFRTHGTWLHGNERGSVNRHNNKYGTRKIGPESTWLEKNKVRLIGMPVTLNARQRASVKKAIKETCRIRGWKLLAINVRTNHIHVVIAASAKAPGVVLNALKSNATRILREKGYWVEKRSPWVDKGSTRYLWNEKSVNLACDYTEFEQGDDLPEFE